MIQRFLGQAVATYDVVTLTVSTVSTGTIVGLTCPTGNDVRVTAPSGSTTTSLATLLLAALNSTPAGEFREMIWTSNANIITGTGAIAGRPSTFSFSGTGGAATFAQVATATGPSDGKNVDNWSGGALPANGDDVILEGATSLLYGLDVFDSLDLASFTVAEYGGQIGLPVDNSAAYSEYRRRYIQIKGGFPIVLGRGSVTPRDCYIQVGSTTSTITTEGSTGTLYLKTTGTGHTLVATGGRIELATRPGDAGTFAVVRVGTGAKLSIGSGATVSQLLNYGGETSSYAAIADFQQSAVGGKHTQYAGNLTAVVRGGTLDYRAAAQLTLDAAGSETTIDLSNSPAAKTLGSGSKVLFGAKLIDPSKTRGSSACLFDSKSLPGCKLGDGVTCT